jgi:outer membrane receptor protein involved in Fe transport
MLLGLLAAALVSAPSSAPSPQPSPSATPRAAIGTVRVVTGTAAALHTLPMPAAALDQATIATMNGTLDAILGALPGFDRARANGTFSNYGLDRLSIGGAGTDRAGLLVDGIPGLDPFGGQVDWALLPSPVITRAELLLGPGSALYGSGAIGGALDLRTFSAADVGNAAFVAPSLTVGGISSEGTILAGVPDGDWRFGVWGDTSRTTFGALPPADTFAGATAATTVTGAARATAQYHARNLTLDLGLLAGTDAQNEGRPNYTFSRDANQADAALTLAGGVFSATLRAYDRDFHLINASDAFPTKPGTLLYTQTVPSSDLGFSLDLIGTWTHDTLLVRAETREARGDSVQLSAAGAVEDAGGGTERTDGYVIEDDLTAGRLQLLTGARLDDVLTQAGITGNGAIATSAAAISPRAAFSYAVTPAVAFRVYAGTGLRTPFLNELVRGYRIGSITYEPSLHLLPERSRSGGLGVDVGTRATRASLDVQSTTVVDAIDFRTLSPTLQMRSNVGRTQTNGATITLSRAIGCDTFDASASRYDARITADVNPALLGERLPYVPASSISAGWSGGRDLIASLRYTHVGLAYADDRNTMLLPAANVVDASLARRTPWGSVQVGATNLGDDTYLSSPDRLAPPSNLWFRISTQRPGSRPRC